MKTKTMKLFLAMALLSAIGCTSSSTANTDTDTKTEETATPEATATPETKETETPSETEDEFEFGTTENNVYTNTYFEIQGTFSDEWTTATTEELDQINSELPESITNEIAKKELKEGITVIVLYAENGTTAETVNVVTEKLPGVSFTIDEIVEANIDPVKTELENTGLSDVNVEKGTTEFLGKEDVCLNITGDLQGYKFFEKQVYLQKGDYMMAVTAVSFHEDTTADTLKCFTELK